MFLLSLDEIDRVKRSNGIRSYVDLEAHTGVSERTWREAVKLRKPTPTVLNALAGLGARPSRVLVSDEASQTAA